MLGHPCYRTINDVPGDIDLAIILTGRAVEAFEEVLARKAKFAVIFAAGFSETGKEGARLERRLEGLVTNGDVRLLGPNTNLNAFEDFRDDLEGPSIALITQSGHQGRPVFQGQEIGIRLTHWAPTGNEVDLEFADFARYFADQPEVGVIACYIEGFKDGRTLMLAADHAARLRKPIVMVKVGKTATGQSMAASHTGHLTGSDAVTSAVFRQFGVTRVDGLDELLEVSAAFARTQLPARSSRPGPAPIPAWTKRAKAPGVCVYAISGGTGAHIADMLADAGLQLPDLTKETQRRLHDGLIPAYLRVSNPVDCGGPPVADRRGRAILDAIVADKNVDIIVIPITGAVVDVQQAVHARHRRGRGHHRQADLRGVGRAGRHRRHVLPRAARRRAPRVPHVRQLVKAVTAYVDYWTFAQRYRSPFDDVPARAACAPRPRPRERCSPISSPDDALSEWSSKLLLKAYGITTSKDELCTSPSAAVKAANKIGFPVVMKVSSPDLLHKSDAGLVAVGVTSPKEVRAVYDGPPEEGEAGRPRRAHRGRARVRDGHGRRRDADRRVAGRAVRSGRHRRPRRHLRRGVRATSRSGCRRSTRTRPDARSHELKGYKLLEGVRGAKPADIDALVDTIMKVQRLAIDLAGDVRELDINPLDRAPARRGRPRRPGGEAVTTIPAPDGVDVEAELTSRLENSVLWLTINRADKGNAIPYYVRDRLIRHFNEAHTDLEVRAIVLTAAGDRHFCTGADLTVRAADGHHARRRARHGRGQRDEHDAHRVPTTDASDARLREAGDRRAERHRGGRRLDVRARGRPRDRGRHREDHPGVRAARPHSRRRASRTCSRASSACTRPRS